MEATKSNWSIFVNYQDTRKTLYSKSIQFSYTNHPSIGNKITRKKIEHPITNHTSTIHPIPAIERPSYPARNINCRKSGCASCQQIQPSYQCVSYQTGTSYPIKDIYSCDTKGAIYLLECPICYKQYIGESGQTIRSRMKHHRNASHANVNRPLYRHLKEHNMPFQTLKLTIIQQVTNMTYRKQHELVLITEFKTKIPFGLNVIQ